MSKGRAEVVEEHIAGEEGTVVDESMSETQETEANEVVDEAALDALRQAMESSRGGRPHDYVKAVVALAGALPFCDERIELYLEAAELYTTRFKNQAEAVKAFEAVLHQDPQHPTAVEFLHASYEKRRDWEKLIALKQRHADRLAGQERLELQKQIAQLASDRIKKPAICIDLWAVVLEADPHDPDALRALSQLYERDRRYEDLVGVLESLVGLTSDVEEKKKLLQNIGRIAGDRLKDDARAAEAYRQLLAFEPDDRRYQEQLKKRYVALGRWDDLEAFYSETARWDEFIRVLESNESRTTDVNQRVSMLMKVAELWITQKGKPDRAARSYEKILSLDEDNLEAATQLIPLYEGNKNSRGLGNALEVKLRHTREPEARVELLRRLAELYSGRGGNKSTAQAHLLEALAIVPRDAEVLEQVEQIAVQTNEWESVAKAYRSIIDASGLDAPSELRLRLGRILSEEAEDVEGALAQYRAVCDQEPDNLRALEALEQLYRKVGRSSELLTIYQQRVELTHDPEQRKSILYQVAALYNRDLDQPERAIETYRAVLAEDATDATALEALDALYASSERWEEYTDVLRLRIASESSEPQLLDLKYRLSRAEEKHLGDTTSAIQGYREILLLDQSHSGAIEALEAMLKGECRGEAAQILETIYEHTEQPSKLVHSLRILVDVANVPQRRVELLRRIAYVSGEQLGDPKQAFEAQALALKQVPEDATVRAELETLAEKAGAWEPLENLYREIASGLEEPGLARDYWLRLAATQERRGSIDDASASYEQLLRSNPDDSQALPAMDSLFRSAERYRDLVAVYQRRIELSTDDSERETLYGEMATVLEEHLDEADLAIKAYQEVLSFSPGSTIALSALDGLFQRQERFSDLAENLETRLDLQTDPEVQLHLMLRLARLREEKMSDVQGAVEGYRSILQRDPRNQAALDALERLLQAPENELLIAEILEPLYREQGNYQKLISVYEIQERREQDLPNRVALLHQIAELQEEAAGDAPQAFETLARAVAIDPSNESTLQNLSRLSRVTGRHEDMAAQFERLAESQEDAELSSQLHMLAARTVEMELGDSDRSIALYRKVLVADPVNLNAAEALQTLFQNAERHADTSLILQRKAEMVDDVNAQKRALYEAAEIEQDVLRNSGKAILVYHKVLELDGEDARSIDALGELYLAAGSWPELLEIQARKVDLTDNSHEKKLILYQIGAVYERELQDTPKAIDTYQRVLELDPDDLEALGRLDALYGASEDWNELLTVLVQQAELTADAEEAVSFHYRIAELYETKLNDLPRAIELYRDILNIKLTHEPTLRALERIKSMDSDDALSAATVLEPVYQSMGESQLLVGALEVQVARGQDPFTQVDLLRRIAELHEDNLADPGSAFATYARALEFNSRDDEVLSSLERLADSLGRWPEVTQLYGDQLERLDSEETKVELGMRVAQLYELKIEDSSQAVERYQRVVDLEPDNQVALGALDRLYTQTAQWSSLVTVLERQSEVGETPEEILEHKFRLGQVQQHQLQDVKSAVAAYSEVLNAAPEHEASRDALESLFDEGVMQVEIGQTLEPLYQTSADWEKLSHVHRAQLNHVEDPKERLDLYYRIAEETEENLLDASGAFDVYAQALLEQPLDERALEELERLGAEVEEGWVRLAVCYADVVSQEDVAPRVQAALGNRLARVYEEELGDYDKATESYAFVLSVVPGDTTALSNLDRIYSGVEEWSELSQVLEARAASTDSVSEKVEHLRRVGQVYEEHLGQVDDAERVYRGIFEELEPENREAIEALERIYHQKQAWQELSRVYERQLENAAGEVEEADCRAKIARLAWQHLGQADGAIEGWKRVLELRGEDGEAHQGLADLYEGQERWAELSDVLERHYDSAETDEERVLCLSRRARLTSEQLGRDDEALETWQRVLDIDFSNAEALRAIVEIWRRREDHREVVTALHSLVDQGAETLEAGEVADAYRELGKIYGGVLEQPYEAAEAWVDLLRVAPADLEAMDELEKVYRAEERWEDVVEVKLRRSEALEPPEERIRELLEVTELWKGPLESQDGSTEAYQKILEVDSMHDYAFEELERLHKASSRWEPLVELYLERREVIEDVHVRSELLRRIAKVFEERLDDNEQAFVALQTAFNDDFHDDATADYLGRMAQATGSWKELIADTQALYEEQQSEKDQIQLDLRLGRWHGEELGLMDWANFYYSRVIERDPGNVQVLRQMANIYRLSGNWSDAGNMLRQAEEVAVQNEDRRMIYVDQGDLLRKHMGETGQSVAYYKRALAVDPHVLPALDALESIYTEQAEFGDLSQILRRKVEALKDPDELVSTRLKLAELYETQLGEQEKAVDVFSNVVQADGTNLTALRGLERVYEKTQRWTELVDVLEKQLQGVQSERERVEVLLKLATLQEEQFLKSEVAAGRLEQALEINPSETRAYDALARCYRRLKRWDDLVEALERHISETPATEEKLRLYSEVGAAHADGTGDVDQAIIAYQNIIDLEDTNTSALDALAKLYEKRGDTHESIDCLRRVADLTVDGDQRVDMYYRIGRVQLERLEDRFDARESFERALDVDPSHVQSITALRKIALDEADWDAASRLLEQEQAHTQSGRGRARLLVELGRVREEHLGEPDSALLAFQQAIEADPDCEEAAEPLVNRYVEQEKWEEAAPLAELLVRRNRGKDKTEQHRLNTLLGRVQGAMGNQKASLDAFSAAYQMDVTSHDAVRGIAEASYALNDWPTAQTNYQKVLTALPDDALEERTEVYFRLGEIKRSQGQSKQAINNFEKALALNGEHRATLRSLIEVYSEEGQWSQVAEYKRQVLDTMFDEDERYELLLSIADVWSSKAGQGYKAIDALEEAYELRPSDHVLLHKLLQLYQQEKEWSKMIDTLQAIAELESNPTKRSRYFYTMAQLYRDKLEDAERAVELFNEALDLNPDYLEAFERINKILTQTRHWKQLERNYRKMLHRVAGKSKDDLEHELWYQLGLVYRDRLQQLDKAIEAFRGASQRKSDDVRDRRILSELYEVTERYDEAIVEQRFLLQQDPLRLDSYRALYRLFLHKQSYDEAWCAAAAMAFMGKAEAEEQRFFDDYAPKSIGEVSGRLAPDHWKYLFHKTQDPYISAILETISVAALRAKVAQTGKGQTPDKRFKQDPAASTITFARTFGWASQKLGVAMPELYVRSDQPGGVQALATEPRSTLAGKAVLSGYQTNELSFLCGKHLATYRPELYLTNLFSTQSELMIMLLAGVMIASPQSPVPKELASHVTETAKALNQYLGAQEREHLRKVVKAFIQDGARANIKQWLQGAELTSCRAGLVLCRDLGVARKIISAERATPDLPAPEKMKELLVFSLSPEYTALRKVLGVDIKTG